MAEAGPDQGFLLFMAESLLAQSSDLSKETDGVLQGQDIEFIHRMRVASRRLRTRLELFGAFLPNRKAEQWRRQIKRITRSLGNARDLDVQIKFLQDFLDQSSDKKDRPGLKRILLRFRQRRDRLQKKVVKVIEQFQAGNQMEEMEGIFRQIRTHARLRPVEFPSPFFFAAAQKAVSSRLEEMLSWEDYVKQPDKLKELHSMRIAAKHLRYAMETFDPAYPAGLKDYIKAARKVQDLLGDVHDCDVWIECLPRFIDKERDRSIKFYGHSRGISRIRHGILALEKDRKTCREERYAEFVNFWAEIQENGLWKKLLKKLDRHAASAPKPASQPKPTALPEDQLT
jgi:CHAD domain-containing protein